MLITFEGIDASGKTTQLELLSQALQDKGYPVVKTRQPGGTAIGQLIRSILLNPENVEMVPETEVLLYVADRIQHIKQVIEPAAVKDKIVLCDRYHDATMAYQGGGRQLDLSWLLPLQESMIPVPDLTLWFDLSVEESQKRLRKRNEDQNVENCRLEREDIAFFNRIRSAYREFAASEPKRFIRLDAVGKVKDIQKEVEAIVLTKLENQT